MGTNIEWATEVWNVNTGCTRASAGCDNCYAVRMTRRLAGMGRSAYKGLTAINGQGRRQFNGVVRCHEDKLAIPLHWRKPRRVFVNSMSDLFHRDVPFEFIDKVFAVMALCPQHVFMVLTKRPERMAEYLSANRSACLHESPPGAYAKMAGPNHPLPNIWLGTSIENQAAAAERIPYLLKCPAAVRFLSCEPLLGPIVAIPFGPIDAPREQWPDCTKELVRRDISWVIAGGESGPGARPCDVDWIRWLRDQCAGAGVAFYLKQLGAEPGFDPEAHSGTFHHGRDGLCIKKLADLKGGDPAEWPLDLQNWRAMPKAEAPA